MRTPTEENAEREEIREYVTSLVRELLGDEVKEEIKEAILADLVKQRMLVYERAMSSQIRDDVLKQLNDIPKEEALEIIYGKR